MPPRWPLPAPAGQFAGRPLLRAPGDPGQGAGCGLGCPASRDGPRPLLRHFLTDSALTSTQARPRSDSSRSVAGGQRCCVAGRGLMEMRARACRRPGDVPLEDGPAGRAGTREPGRARPRGGKKRDRLMSAQANPQVTGARLATICGSDLWRRSAASGRDGRAAPLPRPSSSPTFGGGRAPHERGRRSWQWARLPATACHSFRVSPWLDPVTITTSPNSLAQIRPRARYGNDARNQRCRFPESANCCDARTKELDGGKASEGDMTR